MKVRHLHYHQLVVKATKCTKKDKIPLRFPTYKDQSKDSKTLA